MSESVSYLIFVLFSMFANVWIMNHFWSSFLEKRKTSPLSVIPWLLLCASQILIQYYRHGFSLWFTLINTLLMLLVVLCGYEYAGWKTYMLFFLFCAVWALIELSIESFFSIIQAEYESVRLIAAVSSMILMMTFSYIVSLHWNKRYINQIPNRFAFTLLLVPIGSIFIMVTQYRPGNTYLLSTGILSILLLFNIITFDAYTRISRFFLLEKENAVHAEQLSMIAKNMEEQKKLMEEFYEQKHNLINELTALRGGMNQETNEETIRNLDKILARYHGMESVSTSGNDTVDAIINAKYATAKEYGIAFHLHISVPEELAVEPCDLGVVIGNALDNAITSVKECTDSEKIIEISMGVRKNAWIMVMKNPYEHAIKRNRSGEILSCKPEKRKHGYGLRSIRRIANDYAGDVIIDTKNGLFSLTIVLNLRSFDS